MQPPLKAIGKIERHPIREVWPREDYSFTPWLVENIEVVGDVIGIELVSAEREQAAGSFSLDILAEDVNGDQVIIENQFGQSDHDHRGKVITYLTAFEAERAVWIVGHPRPEHVRAVTWLNEASSGAFYLLKLEAISIGDSPAAPLLTLIVGPSDESRRVGSVKRERAERHQLLHDYWTQLLEVAATKSNLHSQIEPGDAIWLGASAGIRGLALNYVVRQRDTQVELYIDRGKDSGTENEFILRELEAKKHEIESQFGEPLEWQLLDGRRACRIRKRLAIGGYSNRDLWPKIIEATVDAMVRLEAALRPHLAQLKL